MQKIPIDLAEPGMILAKPIISESGMQLCAEETVLSDSIIARLKKMQITTVTIKGEPVDSGEPDDSAVEIEMKLDSRFSKVTDDPLMQRVRTAIEKAMVDAGKEGGADE